MKPNLKFHNHNHNKNRHHHVTIIIMTCTEMIRKESLKSLLPGCQLRFSGHLFNLTVRHFLGNLFRLYEPSRV